MKMSKTIHMSDTVDHFNRRIHVNVRDGKTTMVYRWKDRKSAKMHTQRMTLDDNQTARLLGLLVNSAEKVMGEDAVRNSEFGKTMVAQMNS